MKKIYFFSNSKLQFVEIKNFYKKFLFLVGFFSLIGGFLIFGSYYIVHQLINPDFAVSALQSRNKELEKQFKDLLGQYKKLNNKIDKLYNEDNSLRLAVNLDPLSDEERNVGTGGNDFEEIITPTSKNFDGILKNLNSYVRRVSSKVNFEINNYDQISNTLKLNKKLYASIPAIKPMEGRFGDRFGIRMHPILHVRKMHNGIDLISNVGTKVYAPGGGRVSFTGYKGGYGKVIEINHGFGYVTLYGHLSKIYVHRGQKVKRGDLIALSGNSGKLSTGPHLHYEVRHDDIPLNPRKFMFDDVKLFDIVSNNHQSGEED